MKSSSIFPNIKKGDIIIFIIIGLIIVLSTVFFFRRPGDATVLKIYRDGEEYATYSLSQSSEKKLSVPVKEGYQAGYNTFQMKQGVVSIIDSSCPNKDCIRMGSISKAGDVLICLPHKLMLRLEGGDAVDAVSY